MLMCGKVSYGGQLLCGGVSGVSGGFHAPPTDLTTGGYYSDIDFSSANLWLSMDYARRIHDGII